MAYTLGVFFLRYGSGSDAARTALTVCTASNPSGSIIRMNKTAHGLVVDAIVDTTLFTAWLNGAWKVSNVVDADNFDLEGTWQAAADASGTVTPRGGSSFADAWATLTLGPTAARVQPGDLVKLEGSPSPTSLGVNGEWTDGPQNATISITSSTNATPIVVTRASHGLTTGDTVIVNAHTTNTRANGTWEADVLSSSTFALLNADGTNSVGNGVGGATGTFRKVNNLRVMLASNLTQNVACIGNQGALTNWTASANVTCSVSTADFKQGGECQSIALAGAFTTGMAAYFPTGTLNLSGYQQLSFRIKQTAGTVHVASSLRFRLCSDTAGVTTVDTLILTTAFLALNRWMAFTLNNGAALGASIASIAVDFNTDSGAQTFLLDDIIACKAASADDSISLTSLIGKGESTDYVDETYCAIQSINDNRVMLDAHPEARPTTTTALPRGYSGATETVEAWKRETIKTTMVAAATTVVQSVNEAGTAALPTIYSGGWNRTDMSTQDGETWYDGQNGLGYGINEQSMHFTVFRNLAGVRYETAIRKIMTAGSEATDCRGNNNSGNGIALEQQNGPEEMTLIGCYNGTNGVNMTADNAREINVVANGNGALNTSSGLLLSTRNSEAQSVLARNNAYLGLNCGTGDGSLVKNLVANGNATADVGSGHANAVGGGRRHLLLDALLGSSLEFRTEGYTANSRANVRFISKNHDGAAGYDYTATDGGVIYSEGTVRHTASGRAWALSPTAADRDANYPLDLDLMTLPVLANQEVTVGCWMHRTSSGSINGRLMCKGGQIAGVSADVSTAIVGVDAYELVEITFEPTEDGVVTISAEAWPGGIGVVYVDDLEVA